MYNRDLNKLWILTLQIWGAAQDSASLTRLPGAAAGPRTTFWQGYRIPNVSIKEMEISDFGDVCPFLNFLLALFTELPFSPKLYSQQHYLFFKQEDC